MPTKEEKKKGLGVRATPAIGGEKITRVKHGPAIAAIKKLAGRLTSKPESVVSGGRPFSATGVKYDVPHGPPRPDKPAPYTAGVQKHMFRQDTEAPTITAPAETAVSRMPMPERPAIAEVPGDVETKKPGGYAFGKGGGVTPVPVREAPKPERMGRFVDPTQAYTIGGPRGVGKQDVIGGQDYLDLQKQKEKIMGSIAYRDPDTAKEGAGAQQKLLAISKEMREIRTGVEAGIKDRYGAKTTRGEARSSADAVRSGLEEKQRVRIAEAEQFEIEEARRSQVATAQVAKIGVEAKAAYAGAAPKYDPLDPEGSKAAMAAWEERYRSGGVGAKKAVTEDYTQYK